MKKWVLAWLVFTAYLVTNLSIMQPAEQPHLAATMLLGFFLYLILGLRGVYGAAAAVTAIVLLAVAAHQLKHPSYAMLYVSDVMLRLALDCITIVGGGGLGFWVQRMLLPQK